MGELSVVAELMAIAARTAPKAAGKDYIVTAIIEGDALRLLGEKMCEYGVRTGKKNFDRDGANVSASTSLLLVGIKDAARINVNCGACGAERCADLEINTHEGEFRGPNCAMRLLDMGIALGSAVKTASMMNVDNRIMYRAGAVAREMGLIDADFVIAIPLSASGKSIYFDR